MKKYRVYEVLPIEREGRRYAGIWHSVVNKDDIESYDNYLSVVPYSVDLLHEDLVDAFEQGKLESPKLADEKVVDDVKVQLRTEAILRTQKKFHVEKPVYDVELAYKVIQSAWEHEYIGQSGGYSHGMTTNDLVDILMIDDTKSHQFTREMFKAGKVGTSGVYFVDFNSRVANYAARQKLTGHQELDSTDLGTWFCEYCRQTGFEDTDASDYPCNKAEENVPWIFLRPID